MKIVCAGPSGSGKTTLAKAIAKALKQEYDLQFIENSAGLIMLQSDRDFLKAHFGYDGNWGQVKVINYSNSNPKFGIGFQEAILNARKELFEKTHNAVFDRSPLDPIVFFMNQCVHNTTDAVSETFLSKCCDVFFSSEITHIIRVPDLNPDKVENNGSRCSNKWFQSKIDWLYSWAIEYLESYAAESDLQMPKFMEVKTWDWDIRLETCLQFIQQDTSATI